ncbi:BRCT domain-containing protein [Synechocystis sp. FACHB-383]|uniref:BRCT domain-containing protein n=1 Tax=Synechocystis sp. FACHB-383 TaxID=2692864 RepID=UPI0016873B25|nr:BRCT domain-containing protein [Synechocystis sp. FACHB-383]MBD2653110.1 BRCT domain-containing protein [Synechocystis sp. FACHB-383]
MDEDGTLGSIELVKLAKQETKQLIKAIEIQDIAMGNSALKSLKKILDASVNAVDFDEIWHDGEIEYANKGFCFTGKFLYGDREKCQQAVIDRGGIVLKNPTSRLDYLIVGGEKNPDWAHENYGRKIERVLELRKDGGTQYPLIVFEPDWVASL